LNLKKKKKNFQQTLKIRCIEVDPRFSQTTGGVDVKTWGPSPPDMIDLEVKLTLT
jgi:hypothetical protein